jgi:hypothetical protein
MTTTLHSQVGAVSKAWREQSTFISAQPHFVTALSKKRDLAEGLREVLDKCTGDAFRPNVGFLFLSDVHTSAKAAEVMEKVGKRSTTYA